MSKAKALLSSEDEAAKRIQHTAAPGNFLKEVLNGELTTATDLVNLVISDSENPTILDAGCGSGQWVMEMAQKYPQAVVTGVDVKPIDLNDFGTSIPSNCFFRNLDLESDLSDLRNSFDVIHVRAVASQIVDFQRVVDQLFNALKPHGVLLLVAGDQCLYGPNRSPLPQDQSLMQKAMRLLHEYTLNEGFSIESYYHWHDWLTARSDVEKVVSQDVWVPVELGIPGDASEMCRRFLLDYTDFMPKACPGVPEFQGENSLCSQAAREIQEAKLPGVSMRWRFVVGQKIPA
ncbi:hypothetical protein M407DRAFT_6657 [Tulasnella calospora MUT 4182]|uniref:Methyltransferase domain-containing protein n=1 Tax=Tulasnella calospora MUT 4182 TaxID=1051891 RepID=A0A0C3QCT3_9AGAM|nr:hypothetical protein M407DRAFT_6657 [Tulasnella calospora MUT 4182]